MQIEPLIKHRPEEYAYCSHCNTRQKQPSGLSALEYFFHQKYLDGGLVDVEEKYFNEKYITCSECGNVCEIFSEDNTQHLQNENIKSIISSNILQVEKTLLIMHIIKNDEESLLDLYNYYQYIKNKEKETECREKLIAYYTSIYKQDNDIHSVRMLIELYRRNKDFTTALKLIKESKYAKRKQYPRRKLYAEMVKNALFHFASLSILYPCPQTTLIYLGSAGFISSFSRRWRICTATAFSALSGISPQTLR